MTDKIQVPRSAPGKYKPYPSYKDSGVEWLGKIPTHWGIVRVKEQFNVINGSTPSSSEPAFWDGDIVWVTPDDLGELDSPELSKSRRNITKEGYHSCGTSLVPKGSLVLSTRAPIGYLAIASVMLCTNQGCKSLVFKSDGNCRYFYYLLRSARPELVSLGQGSTFNELAKSKLSSLIIVKPPKTEEYSITAFLDRETAKIDALIEKKERLIELLQEKRTALITQAVTKGLNPSVPMKDSGVEWLGEIPAHWEVAPLCQCLLIYTYGFTNPMPVAEQGPYMLTALDVGDGKVLYENARHTTDDAYENLLTDKSRPKKGDVLLTKDGTLGRTAIADEARVCINQSVALLRFDPRLMDVDFVQNALRSAIYQSRMIFEAGGTAVKHIYISRLAKMPIAVPSMSEQVLISRYLGFSTNRIDILIDKIQTVIIHLREYRTALVSAAVTGKIDVRTE